MTGRYIHPFTDFGFKKLFGTEVNKDLLIDFLNSLLHAEGEIKSLTYLPTERLGNGWYDRKAIFDVYCENDHGEKFIVEIQKASKIILRTVVFSIPLFRFRNRLCAGNGIFI